MARIRVRLATARWTRPLPWVVVGMVRRWWMYVGGRWMYVDAMNERT